MPRHVLHFTCSEIPRYATRSYYLPGSQAWASVLVHASSILGDEYRETAALVVSNWPCCSFILTPYHTTLTYVRSLRRDTRRTRLLYHCLLPRETGPIPTRLMDCPCVKNLRVFKVFIC